MSEEVKKPGEPKVKRQLVSDRLQKNLEKFSNQYLVFRDFVAATFFVIAFIIFVPLTYIQSDWGRVFVSIYGILVLIILLALIFEYIIKSVRLQNATNLSSFTAIFSVNSVLGLIIPLIYFNDILVTIIKAMSDMRNYGTVLCQIRLAVVNMYYSNNIYNYMIYIIFALVILTATLFILGGFVERIAKLKK